MRQVRLSQHSGGGEAGRRRRSEGSPAQAESQQLSRRPAALVFAVNTWRRRWHAAWMLSGLLKRQPGSSAAAARRMQREPGSLRTCRLQTCGWACLLPMLSLQPSFTADWCSWRCGCPQAAPPCHLSCTAAAAATAPTHPAEAVPCAWCSCSTCWRCRTQPPSAPCSSCSGEMRHQPAGSLSWLHWLGRRPLCCEAAWHVQPCSFTHSMNASLYIAHSHCAVTSAA